MFRTSFLSVVICFAVLGAVVARAETVAEMNFATAADNGSGAIVTMTSFASKADGQVRLEGDGSVSTLIDAGSTGISDKWSDALTVGFLNVAPYPNYNNLNMVGMTTLAPARDYLYSDAGDYSGFGNGQAGTDGGTVYFVIQPQVNWNSDGRFGLFGCGAALSLSDVSMIDLYCRDGGTLYLDCGSTPAGARIVAQATVSSVTWSTDSWYFVAASWRSGEPPVLYVRELSTDGPVASLEATLGTVTKTPGFQDVVPDAVNGFPFVRPFSIGARWTDTGGAMGSHDGAGAKIAYFRLDNTYSTTDDVDRVFQSLGAD